jgi:RHS repeat-associated protein
LSKCQFEEFQQSQPPRWKFYTTFVTQETHISNPSISGTNGYTDGGCIVSDGFYYQNNYYSDSLTESNSVSKLTCKGTDIMTGTLSITDQGADNRVHYCNGQTCEPQNNWYGSNYYSATATIQWAANSNGVWGWSWVGSETNWSATSWANQCGGYTGTTASADAYLGTVIINLPQTNYSVTPTQQTWSYAPPSDTDSGTTTYNLYNEYTDGDLYTNILNVMPGFSSWYTPNGSGGDYPNWTAESDIDASHTGLDEGWNGAVLRKLKYHFAVPDSQTGSHYRIDWDVITWDINTGSVDVQHLSTQVVGDGNNPTYSQDFEAAPPYWDASDYDGTVIRWVDNVRIFTQAAGPRSPPGTGPYPNSTLSQACSGCSGGTPLSLSPINAGAISAQFSLGQSSGGYPAGSLILSSDLPSLAIATPAGLTSNWISADTQLIVISNQIRQVKAPQAFADIITDDAFTYEIDYYLPSQYSSTTNSQGVYTNTGSFTPFVIWKIQNPDSSTNTYNRVQITETRGSTVNTYLYTYTAGTGTWTVDYPGSLREDQIATTITATLGGSYTRTVTTTTGPPGSANQLKVTRVYQQLNGSAGGFEALVQETFSPDSNPKTTMYTYAPGVPNSSSAPLQEVVHPDGSWEYYKYYDAAGQQLQAAYSGFGDQSAPTPSSGVNPSQCRYTQYSYTPVTLADGGTNFINSPRSATTYLLGNAIAQSYLVVLPGQTQQIRCQRPTANWNDTDNLVTITQYYTNGPNLGRVESVTNPDGTMTIYQYSQATDGSQTNTVSTGQPDGLGATITNGTQDVTILGPYGQMISHTVIDIASSITVLQDIYGNYDSFSRPQQVSHLDGTTEYMAYTCCALDHTIDRDGVTTYYTFDAMKRQTATVRLNITSSNILDSVGRTLQSFRTGSDSSQILLSQAQYDLAGRLIAETNALGGRTAYSESADGTTGGLVRTTTYPDGGTRIESYFLDGTAKTNTGTAVHGVRYVNGVSTDGSINVPYATEIKLNADGTDSAETTTSYSDPLGRAYKTVYADGSTNVSFFNNQGQLWKQVDPDGVATLYQYNGKGEVAYTAIDTNQNNVIDRSGGDRITLTVSDVVNDHNANVQRTRTYVWDTFGVDSSNLVSIAESSVDGLQSWQTVYRDPSTPVTSSNRTVYSTGGNRYVTNTAPDGSYTVSAYLNGRLSSVTAKDSGANQITKTTYAYDAHGRQYTVTDARNGATTFAYNAADMVTNVTTPNPGTPGGLPQTTITCYNQMLQATNILNPDATTVTTEYYQTGEIKRNYGARVYPTAYSYDYAGRMKTMTNWTTFPSTGARVTTWNYDSQRGWLTSKTYDGNTAGPSYGYTAAGRLQTRTWARGVTTTYGYDNAGGLTSVGYSAGTPDASYTYDRLGRQSTVLQNGTTTTFAYNLAGETLSESYSGGILSGLSLTNGYDTFMRRTNLTAVGSGVLNRATYGYDAASRLKTVTAFDASLSNIGSATYNYLANSPLVSQILFTNSGTQRMTTTKTYDLLNRLTSISSIPSRSPTVSFAYQYNSANQRTRRTESDLSYWSYGYDSLGQLTSGKKFWPDMTPVAGQQFEYAFDNIGNRTSTKAGGDQNGANLRSASHSANNLNQYTSRDVPGFVDVMGVGITSNSVTVNSQTAYRKGEYFRAQVPVDNTSAPQWTNMTASETGQSSVSGNCYLPKTAETFNYDPDGNMTNDGRWSYSWDAENRLTNMTSLSTAPSGSKLKLDFTYDWQGRRARKVTSAWVSSAWSVTLSNLFAYDGWNLLAEINATNGGAIRSYAWGSDLSGSTQGAGGVGGLVEISDAANGATFPAYDGNGNVAALAKATDGTATAQYEYGPFGEVIRKTGSAAHGNPIRFSTKYQDDETELVMYPARPYSPYLGRFLSKDPIEEEGGANLFVPTWNQLISAIDPLGLKLLIISVARDYTMGGPAEGTYDKNIKERNPAMQKGLQEVIDKCTACTSIKATAQLVYNSKTVLPVPEDIRNKTRHAWDLGLGSDVKLMLDNYNKLSKNKVSVPMFWTLEPIIDSKHPGTADNAGVGFNKGGITLSYSGNRRFQYLLAHELGHYVGLGHAPDSDVGNVMHREQDGSKPDAEYCKRVLQLFK